MLEFSSLAQIGQFAVTIKRVGDLRRAPPPVRKAYVSPNLKQFGPVGRLTQSGTGLSAEMTAGGSGMCTGNSMQAMC